MYIILEGEVLDSCLGDLIREELFINKTMHNEITEAFIEKLKTKISCSSFFIAEGDKRELENLTIEQVKCSLLGISKCFCDKPHLKYQCEVNIKALTGVTKKEKIAHATFFYNHKRLSELIQETQNFFLSKDESLSGNEGRLIKLIGLKESCLVRILSIGKKDCNGDCEIKIRLVKVLEGELETEYTIE